MNTKLETATLAGGCFWCLEAVFDELKGVVSVESGYTGGHIQNPGYKAVCTGSTGHAEAVQIVYDPLVISYEEILRVFFAIHDEAQRISAEKAIKEINGAGIWGGTVVTEVSPMKDFYKAEDHHQEYFANNPYQPYCMAVVAPKVLKFRKHFTDMLKQQPA